MKNGYLLLVLVTVCSQAVSCVSGTGPCKSSPAIPTTQSSVGNCTDKCHASTSSLEMDPLSTNGTGTYGKHVKHVLEHGILCETRHFNYYSSTHHMNGTLDGGRTTSLNVVSLNIVGPVGTWSPSSGQCTNVACHGPGTMDWHGVTSWTTPADCTVCHSSSFSSALDPLVTNASGSSGKHVRHVSDMKYSCTACHTIIRHGLHMRTEA